MRRDSDIEDAIQIFTKENNEPMLARALYYKGAMTFNTTHDTTQTLQILKQACRYSSIMRQKEKLDLYDLMCRITHDNSYTVNSRTRHDKATTYPIVPGRHSTVP